MSESRESKEVEELAKLLYELATNAIWEEVPESKYDGGHTKEYHRRKAQKILDAGYTRAPIDRKCIPNNMVYTSNPPQYKCKNCGKFWFCEKDVPTCKIGAPIDRKATCELCNSNEHDTLKCPMATVYRVPERKAILWPVKIKKNHPRVESVYDNGYVKGFNGCHDQFMKKIREAGL